MTVDDAFVRETRGHLRELTSGLVDLERGVGDRERVDELFRTAHTLKGNCGMAGLDGAGRLAHAVEDLLSALREGDHEPAPELIDAALAALDDVDSLLVEHRERGEPSTDPEPSARALRERIERFEADGREAGGPGADDSRATDPGPDDSGDGASRNGADEDGARADESAVGREPDGDGGERSSDGEGGFGFDVAVEEALASASEFDDLESLASELDEDDAPEVAEWGTFGGDTDDGRTDADDGRTDAGDGRGDAADDRAAAFGGEDGVDGGDDAVDGGDDPVDGGDDGAAADIGPDGSDAGASAGTDSGSRPTSNPGFGNEFETIKEDVETGDLDRLQRDIDDAEFGQFDDDDELTIRELIESEPRGDGVTDATDSGGPGDAVDAGEVAETVGDPGGDAATASEDGPSPEPTEGGETPADTTADTTSPEDADRATADTTSPEDADDATAPKADVDPVGDRSTETEENEPAATAHDDEPSVENPVGTDDDRAVTGADRTAADAATSADSDSARSAEHDADAATAGDADAAAAEDADFVDAGDARSAAIDDGIGPEDVEAASTDDEPSIDRRDPSIGAGESRSAGGSEPFDAADADAFDRPNSREGAERDAPDAGGVDGTDDRPGAVAGSGAERPPDADDLAFPDPDEPAPSKTDDPDLPEPDELERPEVDEPDELERPEVDEPDESGRSGSDDPDLPEADDPDLPEADDPDLPEADDLDFPEADDLDFPEADDLNLPEMDGPDSSGSDDPNLPEVDELDLPEVEALGNAEFDADVAGDAGGVAFDRDADTVEFESRFLDRFGGDGEAEAAARLVQSAAATIEESDLETARFRAEAPTSAPGAGDHRVDGAESITVDVENADTLLNLVEEIAVTQLRLEGQVENEDAIETLSALDAATAELRKTVMDLRLMPLSTATDGLHRVARDIARRQDKRVAFETDVGGVHLDRGVIDRLGESLVHLVRNAVDHGIESPEQRTRKNKPPEGTVELRARRERDWAIIEIEDDGRGISAEAIRTRAVEAGVVAESEAETMPLDEVYDLVFEPGFSTREEVTDLSGRGVGMDVVRRTIDALDGRAEIASEPDAGTTVRLALPVSVAISEILFVAAGEERFGVPVSAVEGVAKREKLTIEGGAVVDWGDEVVEWRDERRGRDGGADPRGRDTVAGERVDSPDRVPLVDLADVLDVPGASDAGGDGESGGMVVRTDPETRALAIRCDEIRGAREVVVRPYEDLLGDIPGVSGATVRGDGRLVNVIDVESL